ncbi:hypothetical protein HPB50_014512 [Hyalomma asiaticum]|uniref:Uncharacterized protein n=1 Tax=Hyalomma asiaticum TaxID=266040 RepID=A0ACB7TI85_HYAAI|nr:hypothetical protein HPB50_014512 [Hyalomma asiaticum]
MVGRWWKPLISTTKVALRKPLGKAGLSFEELTTVLSEVEEFVKSRHPTYVELYSGEPAALTPADLRGRTMLLQGINDVPLYFA